MFYFSCLTPITYRPIFYPQFLPKLEAVVVEHEELFAVPPAAIIIPTARPKCKREQYSIRALMAIFIRSVNLAALPGRYE